MWWRPPAGGFGRKAEGRSIAVASASDAAPLSLQRSASCFRTYVHSHVPSHMRASPTVSSSRTTPPEGPAISPVALHATNRPCELSPTPEPCVTVIGRSRGLHAPATRFTQSPAQRPERARSPARRLLQARDFRVVLFQFCLDVNSAPVVSSSGNCPKEPWTWSPEHSPDNHSGR